MKKVVVDTIFYQIKARISDCMSLKTVIEIEYTVILDEGIVKYHQNINCLKVLIIQISQAQRDQINHERL